MRHRSETVRHEVVQKPSCAYILGLLITAPLLPTACAYATLPIDKVAHRGLLEKAPHSVEMLRRMLVGLEPLNETLAWAKENDVQDWEEAAVYYLQNYEDRCETWVTPEAYESIMEALEEDSG